MGDMCAALANLRYALLPPDRLRRRLDTCVVCVCVCVCVRVCISARVSPSSGLSVLCTLRRRYRSGSSGEGGGREEEEEEVLLTAYNK